LAVVIEAMTIKSVKEFEFANTRFKTLTSKKDTYSKDVSLSEIIYRDDVTSGLMRLIVEDGNNTFKNISNREFIESIYKTKGYMPMWFTSRGIEARKVDELFRVINSDIILDKEGNIYKRYNYIKSRLQKDNNNRTIEEELLLDIQLTSLYKSYLTFHIYGSIKWWNFQNSLRRLRRKHINANWITYTPKYDIEALMLNYKPSEIVKATTPNSFGYGKMLEELKRLKEVKESGGWRKIQNSSQLRFGRSGEDVNLLRDRLISSGDYRCSNQESSYGECLKRAVKRFQKRHGLRASGAINGNTLRKMNISVDWKIKKILLNLDRIKRLPDQPIDDRYIMVNIPSFRLYYMEDGKEKVSMRVIVGDEKHHTPIFSNEVSFIVLNPYWIIPNSIVKKEIIPRMLQNPNYLRSRNYEVRTSYNVNKPPIDTSGINWYKILKSGQTSRYKFMQPPGPKNALGKIKFKFPNQFSVYLHDTSNRKLFKKEVRAFSHGCIRVSDPNTLLYTFAKHEKSVNFDRCLKILKGKNETHLNLSKKVPVHIIYLTAWVDSNGLLHYFNDIYDYDKKQKRAIL
jgi:murein L,D-transpeptidase YcbB/YkuD